jgi:hypothetical protein
MADTDYLEPTQVADLAVPTLPAEPAPAPADDAPSQAQDTSGDTRQDLLEAVQSAVPDLQRPTQGVWDEQDASPASTARRDRSSPDDADDDGALPDQITSEEMAKYALSAKRRIRKLAKQRHELRAEVSRLKAVVPQAQAADSVSTYLRDNDIGREDFLMMLDLGASLRRGDFQRFYAGIKPYVDLAEQYLGVSLPPDLQNAVRQGQMTTEAATHFSRERMDRILSQNKAQRTNALAGQQQQYFQQQQVAQQRTALANAVAAHVNAWEQMAMKHDPDYAAKRAAVQDTMWAVVRETGAPQSPEHAVNIAREAYKRVNERYARWAPARRPTSRNPSSTGRTTGAAPEAKTIHDAVRLALESARAS